MSNRAGGRRRFAVMIMFGMQRRWLSVVLVLLGCVQTSRVDTPALLPGVWVTDTSRLNELRVVDHLVGDERARALARAEEDYRDLQIVFTLDEASMTLGGVTRTVHYRVVGWQGPIVDLQTLQNGVETRTSLRVDGDQLTWFDRDGEVEFVLRRTVPTSKGE